MRWPHWLNRFCDPIESSLISQRVRAGMARAQGELISRPCLAGAKQKAIYELSEQGVSVNQISKRLGIACGTVYNYVQKRKS
ncbi:hypothetical protein ACFFSP_26245, partial [Persicitalea jodogahamensis]